MILILYFFVLAKSRSVGSPVKIYEAGGQNIATFGDIAATNGKQYSVRETPKVEKRKLKLIFTLP